MACAPHETDCIDPACDLTILYLLSYFELDRFVAVGDNGHVRYSQDAIQWTAATSGTTGLEFNDVAYGNGVYVAVGVSGLIAISEKGESWLTLTPAITSNNLIGITYANGSFVTVGQNGEAMVSQDGQNWQQTGPGGANNNLQDVIFGNDKFVTTGALVAAPKTFTSPDGYVWTEATNAVANPLFDVSYCGEYFIAVGNSGDYQTSVDGTNWSAGSQGGNWKGVACSSNTIVGVAGGIIQYTVNGGGNWTTDSITASILNDVIYADNQFVAVGYNGEIWRSTSGAPGTWQNVSPGGDRLDDLTFAEFYIPLQESRL